jgi:hypothetical protein
VETDVPADSVGTFRISEGESTVDRDQAQHDHMIRLAELRAVQRLMNQGVTRDAATLYEFLRVYEDNLVILLPTDRLVDYLHKRMDLVEEFGS